MRHIVTVNVDGCEVRQIALDLEAGRRNQQLQEGLQGVGRVIAGVVLEREDQALREQMPQAWQAPRPDSHPELLDSNWQQTGS